MNFQEIQIRLSESDCKYHFLLFFLHLSVEISFRTFSFNKGFVCNYYHLSLIESTIVAEFSSSDYHILKIFMNISINFDYYCFYVGWNLISIIQWFVRYPIITSVVKTFFLLWKLNFLLVISCSGLFFTFIGH